MKMFSEPIGESALSITYVSMIFEWFKAIGQGSEIVGNQR